MKNQFDRITWEVTRRCNMYCAHCLRGDQQNLDLSKEVVDKVLDHVESIGSMTFTGGEPTLNLPIIRYIFDELKRRDIHYGSFFIATNGMVNQMELAQLLLSEIQYADDPEMCAVTISEDMFHDNYREARVSPLNYLSFCDDSKKNGDYNKMKYLLRRGRGASADFDGNGQFRDPTIELKAELFKGSILFTEEFYVSAAGEILADCDLSYDMMDSYKVGTVDELESLFKAIKEEEE